MLRLRTIAVFALLALCAVLALGARRRPVTIHVPTPTFSLEVARILQQHCQVCHRAGGIAPFSLVTYQETRTYASLIKFVTQIGKMPPWKPVAGCGEFLDERRLNAVEIDTIARWVNGGAPEGNPANLPPPLTVRSDWSLGTPDRILEPSNFWVPPRDADSFRCFVVSDEFPTDQYIRAVDFRPYSREFVHHILAYIDTSGKAKMLDDADPLPGWDYLKHGLGFEPAGYIGLYLPNADPFALPDGVAIRIPAGARLVLQVHYHPYGQVSIDRSQLGLYFADEKVTKLLRFFLLEQRDLYLPAGQPDVQLTAAWNVDTDIHLLSIGGHMHYIGRQIGARAEYPDGTSRCLLDIDDWDLHWQGMYRYRNPVPLPAGSRIHLRALYDNSTSNPHNPHNPPRDIRWGEEAEAEMCSLYGTYTVDDETLNLEP